MMDRIPLSIKVDTESDVYNNLIKPKRESREIAGFVIDLFELYYESDEVKELLSRHLSKNNPYNEMQERLKEINKKHERNVTNRTFISQYTGVEKEKADAEYKRKQSGESERETPERSEEEMKSLVKLLLPELQKALGGPDQGNTEDETEALKKEIESLRAEKELLKKESYLEQPKEERVEEEEKNAPKFEETKVVDVEEEVEEVEKAPEIPDVGDQTLFEVEKTEARVPQKAKVSSAFSKMSKSL